MTTAAIHHLPHASTHPVRLEVEPALAGRDRLTTAFRPFLAIPHLLLVGGPVVAAMTWTWRGGDEPHWEWGAGGGALGAVAAVVAFIAWFAILFTGRYPPGLWSLAAFYLRWRVRAIAYFTLLRDEYPPFGEGPYPARLTLTPPTAPRNRLTVAFRLILALPQLLVGWLLAIAWGCTTIVAWLAILFTGRMPRALHHFGTGALRWNTRLEAYLLLLHDEYPPFSLE